MENFLISVDAYNIIDQSDFFTFIHLLQPITFSRELKPIDSVDQFAETAFDCKGASFNMAIFERYKITLTRDQLFEFDLKYGKSKYKICQCITSNIS